LVQSILTRVGDDDDLQLVGDNMDETICIGRVKQVYVQAHTVPFPDPKKYLGNSGQQGRIKIAFRRTAGNRNNLAIMVTDPTGKEFGRVDMKSANGLCPLIDSSKANGLMWLAWTEPRRKQANEGPPGSSFSGLIGMTLQLYCTRRHAHDCGKFLRGKNMILARPLFELQRYDYYNPQDGDSLTRVEAVTPGFQPELFTQQAPAQGAAGSNYVLRSVDEIRADVADVFDTVVNKAGDIPTREPSTLIKTELYPHQKQALYFMWDKEQDHSSAEHDERKDTLWKPKYRDNGRKSYIHVITGEETSVKPQACRGGILADEMGLGKTLSILSLVADTDSIVAARDFASKKPPPISPQSKMIQPIVNSKATLLICPLSTMTNWKEQLKEHFPAASGLKWTRYHGSERFNMNFKELANHDIVITTYHIIAKDWNDRKRPLPWINWFRIVLDEAHTIRNPTAQSRATCVLPGQRRWAVTGTPVQNRLEDLGALFNFIKLSPFNTQAGFNQYVVNPFKNADPEVVPKLQLLVSTVTMRRTKEIIKDEVPKRNDLIVRLNFSKHEQQLHDWFEKDTQRKVNIATSGDKMGGNTYARILTAITNMRLICAHGRDLLSDNALKTTDGMTYDNPMEIGEDEAEVSVLTRSQAYDMLDLLNQTDNDECVFCGQSSSTKRSILAVDSDDEDDDGDVADTFGFMTSCYHIVCPKHMKKLKQQWSESMLPDGRTQCQICEDRNKPGVYELKHSDFRDYQEERERIRKDPKLAKKVGSYNGPSTKTQALLNDLEEHRRWSDAHPDERPIKR
jgi:SNF2 family DNA or RNA helicase